MKSLVKFINEAHSSMPVYFGKNVDLKQFCKDFEDFDGTLPGWTLSGEMLQDLITANSLKTADWLLVIGNDEMTPNYEVYYIIGSCKNNTFVTHIDGDYVTPEIMIKATERAKLNPAALPDKDIKVIEDLCDKEIDAEQEFIDGDEYTNFPVEAERTFKQTERILKRNGLI